MMNTKKTAFGITITGAAAAALLTMGAVAPAMADSNPDNSTSTDYTSSVTKFLDGNSGSLDALGDLNVDGLKSMTPVVISPSVDTGDIASGNAVGSGNTTSVPLLSGNDTSVGNGTSIGSDVSDLVDGSVGDISGSVSDLVDSILAD